MAHSVSPGIYTREKDESQYSPEFSTAICGMVGTASKGPVNEIMLITNQSQLVEIFGEPSDEHLALFAAMSYLGRGKQLKYVRVDDYSNTAREDLEDDTPTVRGEWLAVTSGSWGNDISVRIQESNQEVGTYRITVLFRDVVQEVYERVRVGAANTDHDNYLITRINGISQFITIDLAEIPESLETSATAIALAGGDDGAPVSTADIIGVVGNPPVTPTTGLQLFANKEAVDVDMLMVPGVTSGAVIAALTTICENRGDCLGIVCTPEGLTVAQAVAWTNGDSPLPDAPAALNSSYLAVYYPWLTIFDPYGRSEISVSAEGAIAGVIAYTDYLEYPWSAPAGEVRGMIREARSIEYSPTQGERDFMYTNGNVLNPIVNFPGRGIMVFGQRTTQRTASALDRINVRRLVNVLKRQCAEGARAVLFEPNIEDTWEQLKSILQPVLDNIRSQGGLESGVVICDETTNTALVRSRNQLVAKIMFVPAKTVETIYLDMVILPSGEASFVESIA